MLALLKASEEAQMTKMIVVGLLLGLGAFVGSGFGVAGHGFAFNGMLIGAVLGASLGWLVLKVSKKR